jgi:uncharacterized membrane protein YkoI
MRKPFQKETLRLAIFKGLTVSSVSMAALLSLNTQADVCDAIYGVHDQGLNNSQLVTIDYQTYEVTPLGSNNSGWHPKHDIEGLDMSLAKELYGSSGDDPQAGHPAGHLYKINTTTGEIESKGDICFEVPGKTGAQLATGLKPGKACGTEVSAISFNPKDDSLWGWSEECGLLKININDPSNSEFEIPYSNDGFIACLANDKPQLRQQYSSTIEDISWDDQGERLYFSDLNKIFVYDRATGNITQLTDAIGGNVETVEMLPWDQKTLMLVVDGSQQLMTLDLASNQAMSVGNSIKPYTDIEAVAACIKPVENTDAPDDDPQTPNEANCDDDIGWLYVTDYIGDATGSNKLEMYGMAVKRDGDTIVVAFNANMNPKEGYPYKSAQGGNVNFTDVVLDFGGDKQYAVHFADNDNLGRLDGKGLYTNLVLKDVTKSNAGWSTFKSYSNRQPHADLGDISIENTSDFYFNKIWDDSRRIPHMIESGVRVDNAQFTILNRDELEALGLDFPANLDQAKTGKEVGKYTFGFQFDKTDDMKGDFIAYVFTECINDGIALKTDKHHQQPFCDASTTSGQEWEAASSEGSQESGGLSLEDFQNAQNAVEDFANAELPEDEASGGQTAAQSAAEQVVDQSIDIVEQGLREFGLTLEEGEAEALSEQAKQAALKKQVTKLLKALNQINNKFKVLLSQNKLNKVKNIAGQMVTALRQAETHAKDILTDEQIKTLISAYIAKLEPIGGSQNLEQAKRQASSINFMALEEVRRIALAMAGAKARDLTITHKDHSATYQVDLVSQNANSWTYRVSGQNLKQWKLELGDCKNHLQTANPSGQQSGSWMQWTVNGSFTQGQFSIMLDGAYQAKEIKVKVKGHVNGKDKEAQSKIMGPDCKMKLVAPQLPENSSEPSGSETPTLPETPSSSDSSSTTTKVSNTQARRISLGDGSSYDISLAQHVGNKWTYRVKEISGKDLSHWVLGVGNCAKVQSHQDPANTSWGGLGKDGSTGFYGIKWDTGGGFSDALFSFTLDNDYPAKTIDVLAKAGSKSSGAGHAIGKIMGPDCQAR